MSTETASYFQGLKTPLHGQIQCFRALPVSSSWYYHTRNWLCHCPSWRLRQADIKSYHRLFLSSTISFLQNILSWKAQQNWQNCNKLQTNDTSHCLTLNLTSYFLIHPDAINHTVLTKSLVRWKMQIHYSKNHNIGVKLKGGSSGCLLSGIWLAGQEKARHANLLIKYLKWGYIASHWKYDESQSYLLHAMRWVQMCHDQPILYKLHDDLS